MKQLKYFSLFSGVGGFELDIQQAYEIIAKNNQSRIELCNAKNVTKQGSFIKGEMCAKTVSESINLNGESTTTIEVSKLDENIMPCGNKDYSKCTENNVRVVKKHKNNFSRSNIEMEMDTKTENDTAQVICTNSHLKKTIKKSTKFSATTATMQKQDMESVPTCVGFSEIDKYAISIYEKHFPNHNNFGDITTIKEKELPDFDFLCGGFPCQSFSIAGKRKGFEDTRGTLFFDICRIIKAKQPRLILLENVKGLLSHDQGRTFRTIITTLDELGYDLQWQVLNSKDFGVPQNRERVYIVGHLRGTSRPEVFPIGENDNECDEVVKRETQITGTINCSMSKGGNRQDSKAGVLIKQRPRGKNKGGDHKNAPTLTGKSYQDNNFVGNIRRLTPIECERLQGFPDNWTKIGLSYIMEICVNTNNVIENQLLKLGSVLCTTKGGKGMEVQICESEKKEFANIVLENPLPVNSVTSTINPLKDMVMLYSQKETLSTEELIKLKDTYEKTEEKFISKLWKVTLVGNYSKERLSIILISILEITKSLTSMFAKTDENIIGVIIRLNSQEQNYLKEGSLNLRMVNIESVSDTQRYKCLGNAVTINVVEAIIKKII